MDIPATDPLRKMLQRVKDTIAEAGQIGSMTVATSMAGRGRHI